VPRCTADHAARAVIALLTRREASAVVHQPAGMTDRAWVAACVSVREAAVPLADLRAEPLGLVERLGAEGLAAVAGALLAAAAERTPCLLDGTGPLAAALVADRLCFRARGWWLPVSDSPDPARTAAVERLGLSPALRLGVYDEEGRAARACLALLALDTPVEWGVPRARD
jgi:nicotinate-nucleotide--dimethylbenzimidazole phosphoribosyltransferase